MYSLPASPQSIGKVLDSGFKLFSRSFKSVVILALIAAVAITLPSFLIGNPGADPAAMQGQMGSFFASFFVGWLVFMVFYNALFYRIGTVSRNQESTAGEAIGVGIRKILPILIAGICYLIAVTIGSILLIIPGIILMLSLVFYMPLIVCDNHGPISALKTSHGLVWGNWWRTMTVFLAPLFVYFVLYMGAAMVAGIMFGAAAASGGAADAATTVNLVVNSITILISIFAYPFMAAIILAQLNDLKLRKHGADLEERVAA